MEPTRAAQVEKEYAAQHFGFDPSCLTDNIAEDSLKHISDLLGRFSLVLSNISSFF
jgi:hypothetical protein